MKVLLHIDEEKRWQQVLNNATHLLKACPQAMIEIVAHGPAVSFLLKENKEEIGKELAEIINQGIKVCACHHSLENMKREPEDVLPKIVVVPAGILEIIEREEDGYCYIKP